MLRRKRLQTTDVVSYDLEIAFLYSLSRAAGWGAREGILSLWLLSVVPVGGTFCLYSLSRAAVWERQARDFEPLAVCGACGGSTFSLYSLCRAAV